MSIELSLATAEALPLRQPAVLKPQRATPAANDDLAHQERVLPFAVLTQQRQDFSAVVLSAVVVAHALTIGVLLYQSVLQPVEMQQAEPAAMMVSLVSNPAQDTVPEIQETPPEPQPVKPEIKKPQPVKQVVKPQPVVPMEPLVPLQPVQEAASSALDIPVDASQATEAVSEAAVPAPADKTPPSVAMAEKPAEVPVVIEPPRFGAAYLHNPPPKYPPVSRRLGEEGRVMLRVLVSSDGTAETVEIENGSGSSRLDRAAVDAVKTWQFIPAKRDKQPIKAHVIVPIQFSLNS